MSFKPSLSIANFTCRFGDRAVLLDLFEEVVAPAFFDSPPRKYGRNGFYLFDLELRNAGNGGQDEPVIAGQFVRDTELTRSHVLRDRSLVPDRDKMESATSARFVLVLSTHTLLYVPETPHAPPLSMFRSTLQHHLTKAWMRYIKAEAKRRKKQARTGPTLREIILSLMNEVPRPELELIELPTASSIAEYLERFRKITKVEFRIHDTNHSVSLMGVVNSLREQKAAIHAKEITVVESEPSNFPALKQQLNDAIGDGNVGTRIVGTGHNGEKISGTNEHLRLVYPLSSVPESMSSFVEAVFGVFSELGERRDILVHRATGAAAAKLKQIADACKKNGK